MRTCLDPALKELDEGAWYTGKDSMRLSVFVFFSIDTFTHSFSQKIPT